MRVVMWLARCAAAITLLAILGTSAASCSRSCGDRGVFNGAIFVATVREVADDGHVALEVESVESVSAMPTVSSSDVGPRRPARSASNEVRDMAPGTTVTVLFPQSQVDHLRRDIGKRYRVVAYPDVQSGQLKSELQDLDVPCGATVAIEG